MYLITYYANNTNKGDISWAYILFWRTFRKIQTKIQHMTVFFSSYYDFDILELDKTFIEMSTDSHLPIYQPDEDEDILHETQLTVVDSGGKRSGKLKNLKIVAYVSGKQSLYIVCNLNITCFI